MMFKAIVATLLSLICSMVAFADALPQFYPNYYPGNQGFYPGGGGYPGNYNNGGGSHVRVNIRRGVGYPC